MRAGEKNRRIRIEVLNSSKSASGARVETWSLLKEVWAKMTYQRGLETTNQDKTTSEAYALFKLDFINGLSPKNNRVVFNGMIYDIWDVAEFGYREATLLTCRVQEIAGVGAGIPGSAQQLPPQTIAQLTRQGTLFLGGIVDNTPSPVPIISYAEYALTISGINNLKTSAGSIVLTIAINGIPVTGLSAITVNSTPQNISATALNAVAVGDRVTFSLSSGSSAADLEFAMKMKV